MFCQDDFKTQAIPLARIKKIMKLDEEVKMISSEAPVLFAKARNDIAMAISKSDQFDFLIDIVPRHEVKPNKPRHDAPRVNPSAEQLAAQHQAALNSAAQPQILIQPAASSSNNVTVSQPLTLVHQVVTPSGELQQLPIQLTQAQLNMIRLQVQNNPSQPIIIQAQPQQSPQIIQVTSQAQHQPQQQVFLAQVATTQEDS
ncbi:hypothetical protein O3G_MSEX005971 [Manduca sexta]|uniref:Transcription factor CBF/NF-Y/archaeal histone domain-containing protein n=1 Tax=Manduca sexta TaxID=7130 RepID=A0A921Z213_MANSE|nr:hypothetical protein O3G_MSEX005971 [Manduca sexta]